MPHFRISVWRIPMPSARPTYVNFTHDVLLQHVGRVSLSSDVSRLAIRRQEEEGNVLPHVSRAGEMSRFHRFRLLFPASNVKRCESGGACARKASSFHVSGMPSKLSETKSSQLHSVWCRM